MKVWNTDPRIPGFDDHKICEVQSAPALLNVVPKPQITTQPKNDTTCAPPGNLTLTVAAFQPPSLSPCPGPIPAPAITYQWFRIAGPNSPFPTSVKPLFLGAPAIPQVPSAGSFAGVGNPAAPSWAGTTGNYSGSNTTNLELTG